ncbi:MAG TPA: iron ABC transporter [Planctomycetaceae bacterium]|jgi:manganese/zinc/iron transport system permease protein|nr:iron ABC transporter [Planctomycetaceae bacterium]
MTDALGWTWHYDGVILLTGILCAVAASLPGNFLVLRRTSLLGDAVSHAVLPGIAAAFLLTHSRTGPILFAGAVVAGLLTALLTELIRDIGSVDEGASTGVVFTTLFAAGLVLIVQAADAVDLDPGCVLYGALEDSPLQTFRIGGLELPRVTMSLAAVLLLNLVFVLLFFKELLISSFDPGLATTGGYNARLVHYLLMVIVAITAVASFEAAGNILVVAMFIVPPSAALLLTTRLSHMIWISAGIAATAAVMGHFSALILPRWAGYRSISTAGMMTLCVGLLFLAAALFSPSAGVLTGWVRRVRLSLRILCEDLLALLYRIEERSGAREISTTATVEELSRKLLCGRRLLIVAGWIQARQGRLTRDGDILKLTDTGRREAALLVRSHRLWESYLVTEGIGRGRIHRQAETLEHYTSEGLRSRLDTGLPDGTVDPHGSPIPGEHDFRSQPDA